jgi:hypothetical protein
VISDVKAARTLRFYSYWSHLEAIKSHFSGVVRTENRGGEWKERR